MVEEINVGWGRNSGLVIRYTDVERAVRGRGTPGYIFLEYGEDVAKFEPTNDTVVYYSCQGVTGIVKIPRTASEKLMSKTEDLMEERR